MTGQTPLSRQNVLNYGLLLIGAMLPCLLAIGLIQVLDSDDDSADAPPVEETFTLTGDGDRTIWTANTYSGQVEITVTGSAPDIPPDLSALTIDDQPASDVLNGGLYAVGPEKRRIAFRAPDGETYTIRVVQR